MMNEGCYIMIMKNVHVFAPPGAFPQSGPAEPCLIFWMSRSQKMQISENPRGWLGRVDLDSGSYFRFQGSGAAILKGFATIIRVRRRISHQRCRYKTYKRGKSKDCQKPDTSRIRNSSYRKFPKMFSLIHSDRKGL